MSHPRSPRPGGSGPYASANPYQGHGVQTATPAQLVLMLYDGALTALGRVRAAAASNSIQELNTVNRELQRAQAIVNELQVCLDFDRGDPLANWFNALYDYCQHELVEANVHKDYAQLEPVEIVLRELRDGWDEACVRGNPEIPSTMTGAGSVEPMAVAGVR